MAITPPGRLDIPTDAQMQRLDELIRQRCVLLRKTHTSWEMNHPDGFRSRVSHKLATGLLTRGWIRQVQKAKPRVYLPTSEGRRAHARKVYVLTHPRKRKDTPHP